MNVDIISEHPGIARLHYLEYRRRVRQHREKRQAENATAILEAGRELRKARTTKSQLEREDETLMKAYREMALGQRIISLNSVLQKAGVDDAFHPRLAIARADWGTCFFGTGNSNTVLFSAERYLYSARGHKVVSLPREVFRAETWNTHFRSQNKLPAYPIHAIVPSIPAHLRPDGDLGDYHILWEAEWSHTAPLDPLLLRHIAGPMYTILAQWDLTPLERAVLEGRAS